MSSRYFLPDWLYDRLSQDLGRDTFREYERLRYYHPFTPGTLRHPYFSKYPRTY